MIRDYLIIFGSMLAIALIPAGLLMRAHSKARRSSQADSSARD
jgi:hypothetical protein